MNDANRVIRMGETIYPYGVGAIADIAGESFIALDTDWWPMESARVIECKTLEEQLGAGLRVAPSVPDRPARETPGLTFLRFPEWRFCQDCRRMSKLMRRSGGVAKNECLSCEGPMVPMRFVAICSSGSHIQDVSWLWWAHRASKKEEHSRCREASLLEFVTVDDAGEGLSGLRVVCRACGVSRQLNELTRTGALGQDGVRCSGRQPWQHQDEEKPCEGELHAIQRGSASVHIADTVSAIDIPNVPSAGAESLRRIRENSSFGALEAAPDAPGAQMRASIIAEDTNTSIELVMSVARLGLAPIPDLRAGIRDGEWAAFIRGLDGTDETVASDFVVREESFVPGNFAFSAEIGNLVTRVGGVHRIREVRAMTGFRRYSFEADPVRVDLGRKGGIPKWYPATEQFGEGIFIQFSESAIGAWEKDPALIQRCKMLDERRENSAVGSRLQKAEPRFVLLHTLAHLLIRRLSADSGYSSASLRERVYADGGGADPQAGILIYTASGDSEGTLGGLVRQARSPHLSRILLRAFEDADGCSNDPLCMESHGQGMNALNLAACHGCCLVSETSCENTNALLDRGSLVGVGTVPGLFSKVLELARREL
jgi:hypothetical protein